MNREEVAGPRRGGRVLAGRVRPVVHAADDLYRSLRPGRAAARRRVPPEARARSHAAGRDAGADAALRRRVPGRAGRAAGGAGGWRRDAGTPVDLPRAGVSSAWRASLLHLGRPLFAYRAVLGFRHSWLSREVLTFGLFAKLATAYRRGRALAPAGSRAGLDLRVRPAVPRSSWPGSAAWAAR